MRDTVERMKDAVAEARVLVGRNPSMTVLDLACAIVADAHKVDRSKVYVALTKAVPPGAAEEYAPTTRQTEIFADLIVSKGMPPQRPYADAA